MKLKLLLTFTLLCNVLLTHATTNSVNKIINSNIEIVANEITCSVSSTSFCKGDATSVTFTASGTYTSGNVFTAQLSNGTGSFASPVNIGALSALISGTISVIIPSSTITGAGYRIRVVASNPSIVGGDNGVNIAVNPIAVLTLFSDPSQVTTSNSVFFDWNSIVGASSYEYTYSINGDNIKTGSTNMTSYEVLGLDSSLSQIVTFTITSVIGVPCIPASTVTYRKCPNFTLFPPIPPICSGSTPPILPTTSTNGISGTWSPSEVSNTTSGVYIFTPNLGQCGSTLGLSIAVNPIRSPTFTPIAPICSGDVLIPLPTTSTNGITGTWSPAFNNTTTTTYTFTPTIGQCATTTRLTITVNQKVTPTFSAIAPICQGATPPVLPTTSINGITGTWLPSAISNSATGVYFFTPDSRQCATTTSLMVTVNAKVTPTFVPIAPICSGTPIAPLPTTSNNGITGTWSPALNNTVTTTYTFTPTPGLCATTTTLTVTVKPLPVLEPMPNVLACSSYTLPALLKGSYYSGAAGTGNIIAPGTVITTSTLLSVFFNDGLCFASYPLSITIIPETKPEIVTENDTHDLYVDNATVVQPLLLDSQLSNEYSFQWYENGILIDGATNSTYLVNTVSQNAIPRNFTVNVIKGICESTSSIFEVNQTPVPAPSGDRFQSFTQGQTLADIVVIGSNIQWYTDPTANRKASSPLLLNTLLVNGTTYYASQTINGFESPTRLAVTVQVALSNNSFAFKDLQVSPNLIIDLLTIKSKEIVKKVTVYNALGQEVYHKDGNGLEFKLELSHLVSGNYFVKVASDAKQQVLKVVKK